ncbi:unnamed protein product [Durusdinium trenchii]|uniref:Uncharacterized protein n=2 Tax=Durusdinium trenchii TaxID=1381693 RepID=A0ABP0QK73_9DINO
MAALSAMVRCLWLGILLRGADAYTARKPSIAGKSVYFLVTDRFARSGANKENYTYCDLATSADPLQPGGGAWCNGTLQGVIDQLDYIQGMAFDCVWITPVVKALDYTGYFGEDFFDVDPHIGSKETLKELSRQLHARDMCLIIDIVANHVRQMTVQPDYSPGAIKTYIGPKGINPFDKDEYFHTYGKAAGTSFEAYVMAGVAQASQSQGSDAVLTERVHEGITDCGPENMNLTECNCFPGNFAPDCPGANEELQVQGWFGQLADLNQDHPFVRQKLLDYVKYLVEEYDADAFRLDTAIYMKKDFLKDLQEAAGVDILGETTVNNISYHASFQKAGLSGLLNFPAFYQVHGSFCQYHLGGDLGNYHLQGAFTPALPDLRKLASVMQFQNPEVYPNLDLLGNFADNHDEFARIGYYCDADSYRIKNALALMMFARGIPIVYYGTEQGLDGHQANVLEKDAMRKQGVEDKGQAFVRESLWQTRYNTSTWQYQYIKMLNEKRKELGLAKGDIDAELVSASNNHLIFIRNHPQGEIWVFINNNQNWTGQSPFLYCPAPSEHEAWYDVFSEERAYLRKGCFMADNAEPKVLVRRVRMPAVYAVERISEQVWILWVFIFLLVASNVLLLAYACRHRLNFSRFKVLAEDDDTSDSDKC